MTINETKELFLHAAKKTAPETFTIEQVNEAVKDELQELCSSYNQFRKNRYDIYEIITETVDEVVPQKAINLLSTFADVKVVGQNEKAIFKRKIGRNRAKKFLTYAGLSGVYQTFRLDTATFEVPANAMAIAFTIDFERMLDGAEVVSECMDVIAEAFTDAVYLEIQKALRAALNATGRPAANKYTGSSFDAEEMVKLCNVVRSYGDSAVIVAPYEFLAAMGPDAIVPVATNGNYGGVYSPDDIESVHRTGFISIFRGVPVIGLKNTYTDETNTKTWLDPQLAYILPTGGEKVVKVVLEGETQIYDRENRDQSIEVNAYKKMGAGIITHHNWAIYQNTGITQTMDNSPFGL